MSTKKSPHPKQPPANSKVVLAPTKLASLVHNLRNEKVLLDSDLAELYGLETRSLNQAVKRNLERFPEDFMFQLTDEEFEPLLVIPIWKIKWARRPQKTPIRLYRTRSRHAFKCPSLTSRSGGKHRHHANLRPAPPPDGFQPTPC